MGIASRVFHRRVSKRGKSDRFLATDNRGGRNPLLVHSAGMYKPRGEGRSTRVVTGTNPGRVSDNAPTLPSCPVARASTFGRRSLRADRFPTTPPTTVTGFLSNPFFASTSAFLPLLPRRLLLRLVQESGWSYPSYETHVCARIISSDWRKGKERDAEGWRGGTSSSRIRSSLYMCPNDEGLILIACDIRKWWKGDLE